MLVLTLSKSGCLVIGDATSQDAIVVRCVDIGCGAARLAIDLPSSICCDRYEIAKIRLEGTGRKLARHVELIASGDPRDLQKRKELKNHDTASE